MIKDLVFTAVIVLFSFNMHAQFGLGLNLTTGVANEVTYPDYNNEKAINSKLAWMPGVSLSYSISKLQVGFNFGYSVRNYMFSHYYHNEIGNRIPADFEIRIPINHLNFNLNYALIHGKKMTISPGVGYCLEWKKRVDFNVSDEVNLTSNYSVELESPWFSGVNLNVIIAYNVLSTKKWTIEAFLKPEYLAMYGKEITRYNAFNNYTFYGCQLGLNFKLKR